MFSILGETVSIFKLCGNPTHWFLTVGPSRQSIPAVAKSSVPSTLSQHDHPPVAAQPARTSRHRATVEEVDDEDSDPLTPPPRRHVAFETTPDPPSNEDSTSSHASSQSRENFASIFNDSPPHTPDPVVHAPSTPHTPHTPSRDTQTPQTPRRGHGRRDRTPRAGRHSTSRRAGRTGAGPAGNKTEHKAEDVWEFFARKGNENQCNFCL